MVRLSAAVAGVAAIEHVRDGVADRADGVLAAYHELPNSLAHLE